MVCVDRDLQRPASPAPWQSKGHLFLDQVTQSPIQPDFEHFQWWSIHNFSRQPPREESMKVLRMLGYSRGGISLCLCICQTHPEYSCLLPWFFSAWRVPSNSYWHVWGPEEQALMHICLKYCNSWWLHLENMCLRISEELCSHLDTRNGVQSRRENP